MPAMRWIDWVVVVAAVLMAGWFLFDGLRALTVGDYVTPRSGGHAGRLGPWAMLPAAVGIDPRSTLMKTIFVVYGALWLIVTASFILRTPWARAAMLVAAAGSLWYLPFGTFLGAIQIVLLIIAWRAS